MFRHKGTYRTTKQNLRLAIYLSFVAGAVNMIGFYHLGVLTTHVTGHFVFWGEAIIGGNYSYMFVTLMFLLSFLAGSFLTNFILESEFTRWRKYRNVLPVLIEMALLSIVMMSIWFDIGMYTQTCLIIFAMGIQNALVTQISNAIVRTTHLTGLFTDLGIELSQLFFYKEQEERLKLQKSIQLRLYIILFFAAGGLLGAIFYTKWKLLSLMLPIVVLNLGLWHDGFRYFFLKLRKKKMI